MYIGGQIVWHHELKEPVMYASFVQMPKRIPKKFHHLNLKPGDYCVLGMRKDGTVIDLGKVVETTTHFVVTGEQVIEGMLLMGTSKTWVGGEVHTNELLTRTIAKAQQFLAEGKIVPFTGNEPQSP